MELQTRLRHLLSEAEFNLVIDENAEVVICCGCLGLPFTEYFKKEHY